MLKSIARKTLPAKARYRLGHIKYNFEQLFNEYISYIRALRHETPNHEKFIIFGQGRSGTTLLQSLLNCSNELHCDGEILSRAHQFYQKTLRSPQTFVTGMRQKHSKTTYGFHVKIYQLTEHQGIDAGTFLKEMVEQGWKIIYLRRENPVRHALSSIVAEHRNQYETTVTQLHREKIEVDPMYFRKLVKGRLEYRRQEQVALYNLPHLRISYETDLQHVCMHQATADKVMQYLHLKSVPVESEFKRINELPMRDIVRNFESLLLSVNDLVSPEFFLDEIQDTSETSPLIIGAKLKGDYITPRKAI